MRRFWDKVDKSGECWVWLSATHSQGYGLFKTGHNTQNYAHRVVWVLEYGPIPEGAFVCHSCDNPPCVRPEHLFLGTAADNMQDMVSKGRQRKPSKTHCIHGHPLEEKDGGGRCV